MASALSAIEPIKRGLAGGKHPGGGQVGLRVDDNIFVCIHINTSPLNDKNSTTNFTRLATACQMHVKREWRSDILFRCKSLPKWKSVSSSAALRKS
jgi:hypothetical protein